MKTYCLSASGNLRLIFALTVMLLFTTSSVFAQEQGTGMGRGNASPEDRAKRLTLVMKDRLSLTAAQEPKVAAINLKYAKKMDEARKIKDQATQDRSILDLSKQKDVELKAVLTPDQFKSYHKQLEEMKSRKR